mmetsp:Transcript_68128/g.110526  ORF Transcript_68128/g.110526 Transcript_68128/m.110526 type:complete len:97 (-) Transcript_68128:965-1255(-)
MAHRQKKRLFLSFCDNSKRLYIFNALVVLRNFQAKGSNTNLVQVLGGSHPQSRHRSRSTTRANLKISRAYVCVCMWRACTLEGSAGFLFGIISRVV